MLHWNGTTEWQVKMDRLKMDYKGIVLQLATTMKIETLTSICGSSIWNQTMCNRRTQFIEAKTRYIGRTGMSYLVSTYNRLIHVNSLKLSHEKPITTHITQSCSSETAEQWNTECAFVSRERKRESEWKAHINRIVMVVAMLDRMHWIAGKTYGKRLWQESLKNNVTNERIELLCRCDATESEP